jgi:hypothetical protein
MCVLGAGTSRKLTEVAALQTIRTICPQACRSPRCRSAWAASRSGARSITGLTLPPFVPELPAVQVQTNQAAFWPPSGGANGGAASGFPVPTISC